MFLFKFVNSFNVLFARASLLVDPQEDRQMELGSLKSTLDAANKHTPSKLVLE